MRRLLNKRRPSPVNIDCADLVYFDSSIGPLDDEANNDEDEFDSDHRHPDQPPSNRGSNYDEESYAQLMDLFRAAAAAGDVIVTTQPQPSSSQSPVGTVTDRLKRVTAIGMSAITDESHVASKADREENFIEERLEAFWFSTVGRSKRNSTRNARWSSHNKFPVAICHHDIPEERLEAFWVSTVGRRKNNSTWHVHSSSSSSGTKVM